MKRLLNLVLFELKKILNNKKAILFLVVLNVVPIVSSIALLIAYFCCRGFGFGSFQFAVMKNIVQGLFTGHFTIFGYTAPFFLALIIGDSFSTEFGKGYMKMLLVTPISRWQVITAKSIAVMSYLLVAVVFGGLILQCDLLAARGITQPGFLPAEMAKNITLSPELTTQMENQAISLLPEDIQKHVNADSIAMISPSSAFELLLITFVANLMLIGFLIVFSMFYESAILMSFCSLAAIMAIHVFYWCSGLLDKLVSWFATIAKFCFTQHYTQLFSPKLIEEILDGKLSLMSQSVYEPLGYSALWTIGFFALAVIIFSRKQILH